MAKCTRRDIIRIIRQKAKKDKIERAMTDSRYDEGVAKLDYLRFMRDLEEGRIRRLSGKRIG